MVTAIILAAGFGKRANVDKVFSPLSVRPVILYSMRAFQVASCVDEIIVVTREDRVDDVWSIADMFDIKKLKKCVVGGDERQDSVWAGLCEAKGADIVIIHDAARPCVRVELIDKCVESARKFGSGVAAKPVVDTLKEAVDGVVRRTVSRENLWAMETPQVFNFEELLRAYSFVRESGLHITDDGAAYEACGGKVHLVPWSEPNLKITYHEDFSLAEVILRNYFSFNYFSSF